MPDDRSPRPPLSPSAATARASATRGRALTMIRRALRLSLRNVDALITALALPVMLMLMFVYLFGGAIHTGTRYVDYVVPGRAARVRRVRRRDDRGQRRPRPDGRDHRPLPLDGRPRRDADQRPRRRERARATCSPRRSSFAVALAIGFRPHGDPADWLAAVGDPRRCSCSRSRGSRPRSGSSCARPRPPRGSRSSSASCPTRAARSSRSTRCRRGCRRFAANQPVTAVADAIRALLERRAGGRQRLARGRVERRDHRRVGGARGRPLPTARELGVALRAARRSS